MAALFYRNVTFTCGGTIISENFIMTAAHCVKESKRPSIVQVGKLTLNGDDGLEGKIYKIEAITRHPQYNTTTGKNDIALIQTREKINFTSDIAAANLQTDTNDVDSELIVTGWGALAFGESNSNKLLKTNLTTVPLRECNSTWIEWNKSENLVIFRNGISNGQYCAYDPEGRRDSCHGDSGSPLQYFANSNSSTATIVGIVSLGYFCGIPLPSIYTRVAYYVDWIESIVWPQ
ncbi:serine protease persephone-like isoform X2 [Contarinia nasturtii]|nr:serine protease persephone-like isoform X2 [Contarinia nasturtii]